MHSKFSYLDTIISVVHTLYYTLFQVTISCIEYYIFNLICVKILKNIIKLTRYLTIKSL